MAPDDYALCCDDESGLILSNWRSLELWNSLERLLEILLKESSFAKYDQLFAWKNGRHLALAKEPYAWRGAIEEIKNTNLVAKCTGIENQEEASVMCDKPTMLKIAGEITNSLMHSYTSRHRLNFIQRASKVPS